MIKRGTESSAPDIRAKPRLSLVGNLSDKVSATKNMGSTVVGHGREEMAFVFRMPIIDVVRCATRQHTLPILDTGATQTYMLCRDITKIFTQKQRHDKFPPSIMRSQLNPKK